jgi:prophage regulatory protein
MKSIKVFITKKEVVRMTSKSYSSIWRDIKAKQFPSSYKIGPNRVAWLRSEVEDWITSKLEDA